MFCPGKHFFYCYFKEFKASGSLNVSILKKTNAYTLSAEPLRGPSTVLAAAVELSMTNGRASYLACVITLRRCVHLLEMNKCGIYVSINI